jgi:hypothetical protein
MCDASAVDVEFREAIEVLYTATGKQFSACDMNLRPHTGLCDELWGSVALPRPVIEILSVKIDGATINPNQYVVIKDGLLVRRDGKPWPSYNNLLLDDTQVGTWSVAVKYGVPPPPESRYMAGIYMCELIKAKTGKKCRLPWNTTNVNMGDVSTSYPDPYQFLKDGYTGIPEIDTWIKAVNPYEVREKTTIASPWSSRTMRPV